MIMFALLTRDFVERPFVITLKVTNKAPKVFASCELIINKIYGSDGILVNGHLIQVLFVGLRAEKRSVNWCLMFIYEGFG